jgi:small subunit ribosomal protein S20
MANTEQAKKRIRQNEKHRIHNKSIKSAVRTQVRRFKEAVEGGDREKAEKELHGVFSRLDKAAKTNIFHKNTVDRRKSRLNKQLDGMATK